MIHAYAIEPDLAAIWGKPSDYRYFRDKFGLGTPRVLLEIPQFHKWRRKVLKAAEELSIPELDLERLTALIETLEERRCRRAEMQYDGTLEWLVNAEHEYDRCPFAAILARDNPHTHGAVIKGGNIGTSNDVRWDKPLAAFPARQPEDMAKAVAEMLANCQEVRFIDRHFGPENARHRRVMEAMLKELVNGRNILPNCIEIHCLAKSPLDFFEQAAAQMARRIPVGLKVCFFRWREREGGERLHNRYIITDLGGVVVAGGLDDSDQGHTEDINLMTREQYIVRFQQFTSDPAPFDLVDRPSPVIGKRRACPRTRA